MRGTTHKAVGVAVGVAMTLYAVKSGNTVAALGMVTAPAGAMLPDIDHDRSKLGRIRKQSFATVRKITSIASFVLVCLAFLIGLASGIGTLITDCSGVLILLLVCGVILYATNSGFRERNKFLCKHRGIMHTLVVPILLGIGAVFSRNELVGAILNGLLFGYLSHLFTDTLTISGTPLAYPISQETVRMLKIRTGSFSEYVIATILCVCIPMYGYMLGGGIVGLWVLAIPVVFAIGYVTPSFVSTCSNKTKPLFLRLFPGLLMLVLACVLREKAAIAYNLMCFGAGYCTKVIDINSKKKSTGRKS